MWIDVFKVYLRLENIYTKDMLITKVDILSKHREITDEEKHEILQLIIAKYP